MRTVKIKQLDALAEVMSSTTTAIDIQPSGVRQTSVQIQALISNNTAYNILHESFPWIVTWR